MNIWIGISMNALFFIDGIIQVVTKFSDFNVVLTSLRFLFAFLSVLCQWLIYKKYKLHLFPYILTIITQLQLAAEIRLYFYEEIAYNFYKQLLLLYFDHLKNKNPILQYLSIIQLLIEVQIQNQQIHQYLITMLIFFQILVIKKIIAKKDQNILISKSLRQMNSTPLYEQIQSPRKIDLNSTEELTNILDHCCQGIIYFSQNLDIQFINEKAYKLLKAKSSEMALVQLHKIILLGLQQDENINREHREIKEVASSKILLQKADSKMIEQLLASAEKNMKRIESISEKLLDQKILLNKRNKMTYSNNEFKQLLLSFFAETHISQLLEHKNYIKVNKLKINLNFNYGDQIILLHFSKIQTHSNQGGYLIYMNNVTENEKLQQFIQKYQFQTLHFNSFSHELRTPLNCSLSLLQALKKQVSSNNLITQYLDPAIVSNKLLMHQINDILDYASFGLGTFQLNIIDIQIPDIFNQLNDYYHSICQSKGIKLHFQITDNLDSQIIYNDQERIIQILVNLINNSLKFTKQNDSITVQAKVKQNASAEYLKDQQIKFIVKDTGRGISKADLEAINNILHSTADVNIYSELKRFTTKYVGLGFTIGSRMSDELACTSKSYFKIRSVEDKFTKISFRVCNQVQFIKKNKEATIQFTRINSSDNLQHSSFGIDEHHIPLSTETFFSHKCIQSNSIPQILLCDDVAFNLISLKLLIKNIGFSSDVAYDGQQAINAVIKRQQQQQQQYRMIFMDIEMPGLNGYQTTKQLLQIDPKLNIIMCSAYDTEDNLSLAVEYGMKDFIIKPVRIEQLKRLMSKYFK